MEPRPSNGAGAASPAEIDATSVDDISRAAGPAVGRSGADADRRVVAGIVAAHEIAAAYYAGQLAGAGGAGPRAYLHRRGFPAQAVQAAGLGYAPPGWTGLVDHLRARGYTDAELLQAGLASPTRRGSVVDRFRDRITIPVRDHDGQPVAFIARAGPSAAPTSTGAPVNKYLNNPATPAYVKGAVLHGLAEERDHLATGAAVVLVEGPLDRLAVTLAAPDGSYAAVAPGGTAFTPEQITALDAAAPLAGRRVLVACDDDDAGHAAARRLWPMLTATGAWPEHVHLPPGCDPAETWAGHRGDLRRALDDAPAHPLLETLLRGHVQATKDDPSPEKRVGAIRHGITLISDAPAQYREPQLIKLMDAVDAASGTPFDPETRGELHCELLHATTAASHDDRSGQAQNHHLVEKGPRPDTGTAAARPDYPEAVRAVAARARDLAGTGNARPPRAAVAAPAARPITAEHSPVRTPSPVGVSSTLGR